MRHGKNMDMTVTVYTVPVPTRGQNSATWIIDDQWWSMMKRRMKRYSYRVKEEEVSA